MERVSVPWDEWKVVRAVGKGSFGKVYEIQRSAYGFQESAAMKVLTVPQGEEEIECLRAEGLDEASITQTFHGYIGDIVREYRLMISLKNCPNIVHCDDYKVIRHEQGIGWSVFIKMELLTPLMKALDKVSTEEQILCLAKDLCYALVTCQKNNILHRDIKPQNIFLASDGCFKLGDFGIAKTIEHTTHATVGIGTYSYMAPEVLNGNAYGPQADIYSLGMVLYWLLNKKRLPFLPLPPENFTSSMAEEARRRRFRGEPLFPPADGSRNFKKIVLKACAFDPKDRYYSAQDMMDALTSLADHPALRIKKETENEEVTVFENSKWTDQFLVGETDAGFEEHVDFDDNEGHEYEEEKEDDEFEEDNEDGMDGEYSFRELMHSLSDVFFTKQFAIGAVIVVIAAVGLAMFLFLQLYRLIANLI